MLPVSFQVGVANCNIEFVTVMLLLPSLPDRIKQKINKVKTLKKTRNLSYANVNVRQQCMYEDRYRRNLSSVENPTLEANVIVSILYALCSRIYAILPMPG